MLSFFPFFLFTYLFFVFFFFPPLRTLFSTLQTFSSSNIPYFVFFSTFFIFNFLYNFFFIWDTLFHVFFSNYSSPLLRTLLVSFTYCNFKTCLICFYRYVCTYCMCMCLVFLCTLCLHIGTWSRGESIPADFGWKAHYTVCQPVTGHICTVTEWEPIPAHTLAQCTPTPSATWL